MDQQQQRPKPFDLNEPLPPLPSHRLNRSWEPAARHYRDLTPEERKEQGGSNADL